MIDKLEHEGTEVKQPKLIMDCQKIYSVFKLLAISF